MKGFSLADFPVKSRDFIGFPDSYVFADIGSNWATATNCPQNYQAFDSDTFFLMDKNHPDKLVFLSLGQAEIASYNDNPWQYSITIQ